MPAERAPFEQELASLADEISVKTVVHGLGHAQREPAGIEILVAPRRLTAEEWATMQKHTIEGWKIVRETVELRQFESVVRGHHERCDGRGYPDGLSRGRLSLGTRIVTVADSFHAMIADRPYCPPMSPVTALEELQRHRGSQFDPECVDAMVDVVLARL